MKAAVVLCLLSALLCGRTLAQAKVGTPKKPLRKLPVASGVAFVGVGYNLVDANPEGDFLLGGADPGLLTTRRIVDLTYSPGKKTLDGKYKAPDQATYFDRGPSCASSQRTETFHGERSYYDELNVGVEASGSSKFGLVNVAFTASAAYRDVSSSVQKEKTIFMQTERICHRATARYEEHGDASRLNLSTNFANAVKSLPGRYNRRTRNKFGKFLDTWGTHVVMEAELGSRHIERLDVTASEAFDYSLNHNLFSASVSGSYLTSSASLSVSYDSLSENSEFQSTFSRRKKVITSGSTNIRWDSRKKRWIYMSKYPNYPSPIKVVTKSIDQFLVAKYTSDAAVLKRRGMLVKALKNYHTYRKARKPAADPLYKLPVTWPNGVYSIVQPKSGCPGTSGGVTWQSGWRYHDTEDDDSNNNWSSNIDRYLNGYFNRNNMRWHFCTKTTNAKDSTYEWPRGTYCIARKGGRCPTGFGSGRLRWDDEDSRNANKKSGTLPDGTYDNNTIMQFCCRDDASTANRIVLPTNKPFILFSYRSDLCQKVYGMRSSLHWFRWDNEDSNNGDQEIGRYPYDTSGRHNHQLHFCYYTKA